MSIIRWDNVNAPQSNGAAALLLAAQKGFQTALDPLKESLKEYQATDEANWKQGIKNNTDAFLNRLNSIKTPEEMAALEASGELRNMLQGYGAQVDATAARSALDARPGILQQRIKAAHEFEDSEKTRTEKPILDSFKSALLNKDPEAAKALVAMNPWLAESAVAAEFKRNLGRQDTQDKYAADEHDWKGTKAADEHSMVPIEQALKRSQMASQRQQIRESQSRIDLNSIHAEKLKDEMGGTPKALSKAAAEARKEEISQSVASLGFMDEDKGLAAVTDWLTKNIKDPAERKDALNNITKFTSQKIPIGKDEQGNEQYLPISAAKVIEKLSQDAGESYWYNAGRWNKNWGDDTVTELQAMVKDPEYSKSVVKALALRDGINNKILADYAQAQEKKSFKKEVAIPGVDSRNNMPPSMKALEERMNNPRISEQERKSIAKQILSQIQTGY